jgi:hypothetical protein
MRREEEGKDAGTRDDEEDLDPTTLHSLPLSLNTRPHHPPLHDVHFQPRKHENIRKIKYTIAPYIVSLFYPGFHPVLSFLILLTHTPTYISYLTHPIAQQTISELT